MNKVLTVCLALWLAGCAPNLTVEERSDVVAISSLDAIEVVLDRAKTLNLAGTLSNEPYTKLLDSAEDLKNLIVQIESQIDMTGTDVVNCFKPELDANNDNQCDREDITALLIDLRGQIE